ncbi:NAD(P)-binding Rossmann-like domain-containing protein [Raineyella antarctica]|uniref:NAD(P)-binding Rossmann-like domain-containing protein n=1 Tax=Raineyella antarctica TaxID=1577474 RepID=A0A1G6GDV1_9ACTN|nr:NAD(P)-binding protein [Raineyella antarctica]SDB80144.1 NAD(P)-binding Rossmann-like domain-containing protein [Raineyella antarctica]
MTSGDPDPRAAITVVGGTLAGMAAAARLAKRGHRVTLLHDDRPLAADWRPRSPEDPGPLPGVLAFPAPWRDLFKKSGRILPAELARAGLDLVAAPPVHHVFADGEELVLGGDRGAQFHQMEAAYGRPTAEAWRDLVDSLEPVWQLVRNLGLETSLESSAQLRPHRRALGWGRSVAELAATQPHPHLRALVEESAWRRGHDPARTPSFVAARLSVERTFGRWMVVDAAGRPAGSDRLLDLLEERLRTRRVEVVGGAGAVRIGGSPRRPDGRGNGNGAPLDALVLAGHLDDPVAAYGLRTRAARRVAALAPVVGPRRRFAPGRPVEGVVETVEHATRRISWTTTERTAVHDWGDPVPDPGHGPAWDGPGTWLRMLPVRLGERVYSAGPWGRGGNDLAAVLMSAALATYAAHLDLTGLDTHPSNKDQ